MKNAFWLFSVCSFLFIYACSSDSKPISTDETDTEAPAVVEMADAPKDSEPPTSTSESVTEGTDTTPSERETEEANKEDNSSEATSVVPTTEKEVESPKASQPSPPKSSQVVSTPPKVESKPSSVPKTEPATSKPVATPPKPKPVATTPKEEPKAETPKPAKPQLSHDAFDQMLRKYVSSSGQVDYAAFKKNKAQLEAYLELLEEFPPQSNWSKNKKLAYWFNLYNAWTIKVVVDKYPVASITNIDGGSPWKVKRVKSGSKTYSLDEVENAVIRPRFKDARIHFAVNCAAKSCPPLLNKAWTESNVPTYLEKQTKAFINDTKFNDISAKKVRISKIFEWYAEDFGDIITYLNKYSNTPINPKAKVEYIEYDWGLNGK